ncbi:sel1 repeat family protein [Cognatilysobacter lacus]|uniref:Sel1 repeat family protein n=1 Tax=Cognatilysobacter lacus TaxID=1643323 RepID=A0A5D8Z978_9GAMM|nr:sel1 repeat family protein [Lysobacter lacus]TZF90662.1 sel1 repeat family protein [Lysobacter lacus]
MPCRWIAPLTAALLLLGAAPAAHAGFDARAQWEQFLSGTTSYEQVNEAFHVLGDVGYSADAVDPAVCAVAGTKLDDALRKVPVSIALHHAAMLCAEARHDGPAGEAHMAAIAALTRHALAESGDGAGAWTRPVRVVRPEDVLAFVAAAGYDRGYGYFDQARATGGYPLTQVVVDRDTHQERHFRFDWVDTLGRLKRDSDFAGYPYDRELIATAFVDNWAGDDDVAWVDARALRAALTAGDPDKARDALHGAAARGGLMSAFGWMEGCRLKPRPHCADGLVDALLPSAEKGQALARVLLALAYTDGVGIERDEAAARTLVESADASWQGHGAAAYFGSVLLGHAAPWPAWLQARLGAAASEPAVRALLALRSVADHPDAPPAADVAVLELPANNLAGRGLYALSRLPKDPRARQWLERAADAGSPQARSEVGFERLRTDRADARGLALLREAATDGDATAARFLGYHEASESHWRAAELMWTGPAASSDIDALTALAMLYAEQYPGVKGDAARARVLFDALAPTGPAVRREFARFLLANTHVPHEPAKARQMLEQDAVAGDAESQVALAEAFGAGLFGTRSTVDARKWFEKAVATGNVTAKSGYGMWLYGNETSLDGRRRGLELLRQAVAAGDENAMNNLAWIRCVTPVAEFRDARAGLETAKKMGALTGMPAGRIDTVAACHAAVGDFAKAAEVQSLAIAQVVAASGQAAAADMQKRLDLYRAGKAYVEEKAK